MRQGSLRLARCFEAGKALSEMVVGNRGQAPLPDGCFEVLNSIFERLGVVVPGAMRWSGRRHAVECTERGDAAAVSQAPLSLLSLVLLSV
jgi:hypothetical protein